MIYQFKAGSHISGINPQTAGEFLESLRQRDGVVTPRAVVDASRPEDAPLHDYIFRADDSEAAERYRLGLASHVIRCVVVRDSVESEPIQQYVCISGHADDSTGHYITTEIAFSNPEMKAVVLERAMADLEAFRRKYSHLKELAKVFEAIDDLATVTA